MSTITLEQLTPEQRKQLLNEAQAEETAKKASQSNNRKAYKQMVSESAPVMFHKLVVTNEWLMNMKKEIFEFAKDLIDLKAEAYDIKDGQQSHTFTDADATKSITIGYRVTDGWDDTVPAGIEKVHKFTQTLIKDPDSEKLVNTIHKLLRKDANGKLKSSRVLELQSMADEFDNELLNDGIEIIRKGYKPQRSCWYVEAKYTDKTGKWVNLPLSISTVDFPEGTQIDFM